ncbi:MAG: dihydrofolate reductase family protein [Clostridia bacterium]|nr:dihydrofolate reductase family protein [Clostridia bacterium]
MGFSAKKRAEVICHMTTSLDGRVTGEFLSHPACAAAIEEYYNLHRAYRAGGCKGFICGRITMQESFTSEDAPVLDGLAPVADKSQSFWAEPQSDFYAIAFDPKGKLNWKSALISDSDPGYDRAQVIEVLTEQADGRYLAYLRALGISYVVAGESEIDVAAALCEITAKTGAKTLALEGGSVINGHFLRAGCVDALSLVQAPLVAASTDKPLFDAGEVRGFSLTRATPCEGALVLEYVRETEHA